jgi:hypothetical protein
VNICIPLFEAWSTYLKNDEIAEKVFMQTRRNAKSWKQMFRARHNTMIDYNLTSQSIGTLGVSSMTKEVFRFNSADKADESKNTTAVKRSYTKAFNAAKNRRLSLNELPTPVLGPNDALVTEESNVD